MASKPSFTIESESNGATPIVVTSGRKENGGLYITQGTSWLWIPGDAAEDFLEACGSIIDGDN